MFDKIGIRRVRCSSCNEDIGLQEERFVLGNLSPGQCVDQGFNFLQIHHGCADAFVSQKGMLDVIKEKSATTWRRWIGCGWDARISDK